MCSLHRTFYFLRIVLSLFVVSNLFAGTVDDLYDFGIYDGNPADPTAYKLSIPKKKTNGVTAEIPVVKAIICGFPGIGGTGVASSANQIYARWAYENGIAFWGVGPVYDSPSNTVTLLNALATSMSRPELANAPLIPKGESSGAYTALQMANEYPSRTLAIYATHKGTTGFGVPPQGVPAQINLGEFDSDRTEYNYNLNQAETHVFHATGGKPQALLVDRGMMHTEGLDRHEDLMFYVETIFPYRYVYQQGVSGKDPAMGAVTLNTLNLSNGWRGEHLLTPSRPDKFVMNGANYPVYPAYSMTMKDWDSTNLKIAPAANFDRPNIDLHSWFADAKLAYAWRSRAGLGSRRMQFTVHNTVTNHYQNAALLPAHLNTDQTAPATLKTAAFTSADKVDFYDNGTLVFTDTQAPYAHNYAWTTGDAGWHVLYAIATNTATGEQCVSGSRSVRLYPKTVAANTAPTITKISEQTITVGTSSLSIPFTIGDAETAVGSLTTKFFKASSRDDAFITDETKTIPYTGTISGTGADRMLNINITDTAKSGALWAYVQVHDGDLTANTYFKINIVPTTSSAPFFVVGQTFNTTGTMTGKLVYEGGWSKEIAFRVFDADTPAEDLTISVASSVPARIPVENIIIGGYGEFRTVKIKCLASSGSSMTFSVSDGTNPPVTHTYNPTPDTSASYYAVEDTDPIINNIANVSAYSGDTFSVMARVFDCFTASEAIGSHPKLTVAATSSNQTLLPNANLIVTDAGAERKISGTTVSGQTGTATVTVTVTDEHARTSTDTFTVTVTPAVVPSLSTQPLSATVAYNTTRTLSVSASGGAPYTYQWFIGNSGDTGTLVSGATSATYTTPSLTANVSYWARVTNSAGSVNSATATTTVLQVPAVTTQPTSQSVYPGSSVTLSATVTGGDLSYQWYSGTSGNTSNPILGATTSSLALTNITADASYWVRASNLSGYADSAMASLIVKVLNWSAYHDTYAVSDGNSANTTSANITTTPGTNTELLNYATGVSTGVTMNGLLSTGTLALKTNGAVTPSSGTDAYAAFNGILTFSQNIYQVGAATTSATFTFNNLDSTKRYTVAFYTARNAYTTSSKFTLQNTLGHQEAHSAAVTDAGDSNTATASVNTGANSATAGALVRWQDIQPNGNSFSVQVIGDASTALLVPIGIMLQEFDGAIQATAISAQPSGSSIANGETATLSVTATGTSLSYQWYEGASGTTTTPVSGETGASFTTPSLTSSTSYWVRVTGANGVVDSNAATVTVAAATPTVISSQPAAASVGYNTTATLSVTATGTSLSYQWYQGASGTTTTPVSGATSASFTTPNLTATTSYWVRVTGTNGTVDSTAATVTVAAASTAISAQPAGASIAYNATASLSVTATGTSLSYQWYQGASGTTTTPVSGATSASFTTPNLTATTSYWVRVAGTNGTVDSNAATVTVAAADSTVVSAQPAGSSIAYNATASLSVTATGTNLSYQWYEGASGVTTTAVSGATSSSFTTPNLTATKSYWVRVIGDNGTVDSNAATVTVAAAVSEIDVVGIADGGSQSVTSTTAGVGKAVSYTINNSGTGALTITGNASISNLTNCGVVVNTQPTASVAAGGSTTLVLTVTPTADGAWGFDVGIANDDTDETPYNWSVSGTAAAVSAGNYVDIYLIAGQSNADGRAVGTSLPTAPVNLQNPQDDVPFFYRTTQSATPVYETLRPGASGTVGAFGPEITLGRSLADWKATNQPANKVAFIKYAVGGTSLSSGWTAGGTATNTGDGLYYKTFQTVVTAGLAALDADASLSGYTKRIAGIIWVQGEADSLTAVESQAYQANLTAFIADIRLTYGASLPFFFSKLSDNQTYYPNGTGEGPAGFIAVRAAQTAVAASVAGAILIDSDPAEFAVGTDNIHYNAAGQQALGNAFAAAVIATPPIVLPEITSQPASAEISAGQTTTLQVTATGANLTYQWYAGNSGNTTVPLSGATASSYTTNALSSTTKFWVRVTGDSGYVNSATATVTVNSSATAWTAYHAQFFTGSPHANLTTGETATLKKFADGTSTGVTATYSYSPAWTSSTAATTKNNPPALSEAGVLFSGKVDLGQATKTINNAQAYTATLTFTGLDSTKKYTVALYAGYDSSSSSTAQTKFTLQTASGFANASTTGVGDAGDSDNATVSYVSGDVNVTTNGYVARWTDITPTGTGGTSFSVLMERNAPGVVGAICAQAFVLEEIVTSVPAPNITAQPEGLTIDNASTTTLTVSATGSGLSYQWYSGASGTTTSPLAGATSASFTTPALTATASYWVRVSNSGGDVDSTAAFVSVRSPYETWAFAAGFLPDEQTLDPDGDGIANLIEFALGLDPEAPESLGLPEITLNGANLEFSFWRETADLTYVIEASETLAPGSWTTVATNPGNVGESVVVPVPLGTGKKFVRLRIME